MPNICSYTWDPNILTQTKVNREFELIHKHLCYLEAQGGGGSGSVTSVSVVTANGLAGTVATPTTTPAITLSTTVTGLLKGNGTAIAAASSGVDYAPGTASLATGILKSTIGTGVLSIATAPDFPILNQNTTGTASNVTGVVAVANGGTGTNTLSGLLKGNGTAAVSTAVPGTDYQPAGSYLTSVSIASANGFAGSSSGGTTPTLTLSTSVNGFLQGNGTAISAATTTGSGSTLVLNNGPTFTGNPITFATPATNFFNVQAQNLGTTQDATKGISVNNTTAAAAGAQQISPAIVLEGQGWKTNATAASQSVKFQEYVLPVQGTAAPTGQWLLQKSIAGAAYTTVITVNSDAMPAIFNSAGLAIPSGGISLGTSTVTVAQFSVNNTFTFNETAALSNANPAWTITHASASSTSGTTVNTRLTGTYAPGSGTGSYHSLELVPTINQTGGANGVTRGLYVNPTLTAATDFRAIEIVAGKIVTAASVTARAPLNIPGGTAPTSPVNADLWNDGTNLFVAESAVTYTLAKTLTATATLDFPSTAAQSSSDLTITVTGASVGDVVALGVPNGSMNNNSSFFAWVSASNTVTVRFDNYSTGAIDPASGTFRVSVLRY